MYYLHVVLEFLLKPYRAWQARKAEREWAGRLDALQDLRLHKALYPHPPEYYTEGGAELFTLIVALEETPWDDVAEVDRLEAMIIAQEDGLSLGEVERQRRMADKYIEDYLSWWKPGRAL